MTLKFHGIPVNPDNNPGETLVKELEKRTLFRLDDILFDGGEIKKIDWVVSFNLLGKLNFDQATGITKINPDGGIHYRESSTWCDAPALYLILHNDTMVPPGCTLVNSITPFS